MLKESFDDSGHSDFDEWIVIHGKNFTLFHIWYALPKCEIRWNKRSGGAIGIFDFPISLAKWMIVGPEIARMQTSFDETLNYYGESTEFIIRP